MKAILQRPTHLDTHTENHAGTPHNKPSNSMELPSPAVQALLDRMKSGVIKASITNPMQPPSPAVRDTLKKF